jgi:multiple RNA-binding domain-containing protein 1
MFLRLTPLQASDSSHPSNETFEQNGTGANSVVATKRTSLPVTDNREENPLKRKREKPKDEAENPKLKEFLQVMQKPSKKSWQDEGVNLLGGPVGGTEPEPLMAEVEPDSDDEIQTIYKKAKQESKIDEDKEALAVTVREEQPKDYIPPDNEAAQVQNESSKAKSDADWLRSKTSRLLDLVDDDEAPARSMPIPSTQTTTSIAPDQKGKANESQADTEMETETVNVDEEAIRLSRRLFLRNLSYSITEDDLRAGFAQFGNLEEVRIANFHKTFHSLVMNTDRDNLCKTQLILNSETEF